MSVELNTIIKLRTDTSTNFKNTNIVLQKAEPAFELDTNNIKIGDGVTNYSQLKYLLSDMVGSTSQGAGVRGLVPVPPQNSSQIPLYLGSNGEWNNIPETTLSDLGITASASEINYIDGCTGNIQQQLNGKLSTNGNAVSSTSSTQLINQRDSSTYYKIWVGTQQNFPSSPASNVIYFII